MLRFASLVRPSLALVAALGAIASARPAAASNPMTTYVVPTRVDLEPNDAAATRVAIHGAFFQLTSATNFTYSDPKCGVMYFQCVAGQEAMCRMQWKELRAAMSPTSITCSGFGGWNMISTAAVRVEGEPLGTPDAWDLGMGIGLGSYVDNKCPVALRLACPLAANDGGTAPAHDAAVQGDDGPTQPSGAGGATTTTPTGAAGTTGTAGTTGAAGTTGTAGTTGAAGTDGKPQLAKQSSGCALGGTARASAPLALLALGALAFVARARRRRR